MQNKKDIPQNFMGHDRSKDLQNKLKREEVYKNVLKLEDKEFARFLQKKNERIATAIYVITDFLPEEESLRWKLRRTCVEALFPSPENLKYKKTSTDLYNIEDRKLFLHELSSLWNLTYYAGYLSDMNFEILKYELLSVLWLLEGRNKKALEVTFPENFFELSASQFQNGESEDSEKGADKLGTYPTPYGFDKRQSKGHLWDKDDKFFKDIQKASKTDGDDSMVQKDSYGQNIDEARDVFSVLSYRQQKDYKQNTIPPAKRQSSVSDVNAGSGLGSKIGHIGQSVKKIKKGVGAGKKNPGRREAILGVIAKKGDVSVKDIAEVVTGVSEKTLQRELTSLVAEGVLKKEGERRWSRYSIRA